MEKIKIGIIICDRYNTCAGGKCFRSAANREGACLIKPTLTDELTRLNYD